MIKESILEKLKGDILLVNKEQRIIFCSKHFVKKLSYETLQDKMLQDLLWDTFAELMPGRFNLCFKDSEGKKKHAEAVIELDEEEAVYWLIVEKWRDENYSKEELEQILDLMPYAIWIEDFMGKYRYSNKTNMSEIKLHTGLEIDKDKIYNMTGKEIWQGKIENDFWNQDNEILKEHSILNEIRYGVDDKALFYRVTKVPMKDENGNIKYIICIKDSQAERKEVEEELIEGYRKAKQPGISDIFERSQEVKKLSQMQQLNTPYCLGAEVIAIYEYNEENHTLQYTYGVGNQKQYLEEISEYVIGQEEYEEIKKQSRIWAVKDLETRLEKKCRRTFIERGVNYIIHYPIRYKSQCLGVLVAGYKKKEAINILNRRELDVMSHTFAIVIRNMMLYNEVQKELKLRKNAEQHLENLFNSSIALYLIFDFKTGRKLVNLGWYELLGWEDKDFNVDMGKWLIYPDDLEEARRKFREVQSGMPMEETVTRFLCKKGGYKWIKWKARMAETGENYLLFGIDISQEVKNLEEKKAYKKALELETVKAEFLANMSHELKTPLNIIYGILQLEELELKDVRDKEEVYRRDLEKNLNKLMHYKHTMKQNIFRLLRLINNIVDISRLGAGAYKLKIQNCNIVEVIENITMSVADYLKDNQLTVIFDTDEEEIEMGCDIEKIERIMLNLLSNAFKYSKVSGHIWVNVKSLKNKVEICVADDGIGIPKDQLKNIFERFVQVDHSFTRKCEGSGIGLSLVKGLVEMMGGTIRVESELQKGSRFIITLPVRMVAEEEVHHKGEISTMDSRIEKCYIEFSDIYSNERPESKI